VEREPPPITITNPAAPAGGDVLGADPWRPSPEQKRVALVVAAVLVVVGGTGAAVGTVQHDRAADRAALRALRLVTDVAPDTGIVPQGFVRVGLRNDGPASVRLLSAQLVPGGYGETPAREELLPGGIATLGFRDTTPCGPALLAHPATAVRVRLRTVRGTLVTRDVRLGPGPSSDVTHGAQERCGYLPAAEAFQLGLTSVAVQGGTVVAQGTVFDESVLPLTLQRLRAMPGLSVSVTPELPLVLPPQPAPGEQVHNVDLTLRLRVTSCATFLSALGFPQVQGVQQVVRGWVRRDGVDTEVPVLDAGGAQPPTQFDVPPGDPAVVLGYLLDGCRSFVIDHAPGFVPEQP
jgi:hypothetical protein